MIFSFESASQNFLGITDVLYLENYEELRNLVFTRIKTVILTHKNIFWKTDSYNFPGKNNGSGHCVVTAKCPSTTSATN